MKYSMGRFMFQLWAIVFRHTTGYDSVKKPQSSTS